MKSISEFEEIRKRILEEMQLSKSDDKKRVVVGMATCGIAAGARTVMKAFVEELRKRNIKDVTVSMTGCIGVCRLEPIVEVYGPDARKVTYVKMTPEKAARVVAENLVNGRVCLDLVVGASDMQKQEVSQV
jgi:NADP-reducing hydrogenase subunit HndB